MAIAFVQKITGSGATLTLNGVASGNALFLTDTYNRNPSTGLAEAAPTDTNGTFLASSADVPFAAGTNDAGVGIFHQQGAASGTHTVTPEANTGHNTTLSEFSGLATTGMFDVAKSAGTSNFSGTSQVTGTTNATAQPDELALTSLVLFATVTGSSNAGITDPIANYNTLQINQNTATDLGTHHSYRILTTSGTQSATENWTENDAGQTSMACIATFKGKASSVPPIGRFVAPVLLW